jgi:predicted dithiol-disulfide oxidoreductase (DUF899 family)
MLPPITNRAAYLAEVEALRPREKEHTRAGDTIAAARRRLPMAELDASIPLIGPDGPVTLLEAFEGRRQLVAYYHMWYPGEPAESSARAARGTAGRSASSRTCTRAT